MEWSRPNADSTGAPRVFASVRSLLAATLLLLPEVAQAQDDGGKTPGELDPAQGYIMVPLRIEAQSTGPWTAPELVPDHAREQANDVRLGVKHVFLVGNDYDVPPSIPATSATGEVVDWIVVQTSLLLETGALADRSIAVRLKRESFKTRAMSTVLEGKILVFAPLNLHLLSKT